MYKHILVPTDGSALSNTAVEKALAFAKETGAKATVLTVVEPFHIVSADPEQLSGTREEYERHAEQLALGYLNDAKRRAESLGVPCDIVRRTSHHPYEAIIDTAAEKGCDLVAMASHGRRGVSAIVLGSETVKVLTHSTVPVLVYR